MIQITLGKKKWPGRWAWRARRCRGRARQAAAGRLAVRPGQDGRGHRGQPPAGRRRGRRGRAVACPVARWAGPGRWAASAR